MKKSINNLIYKDEWIGEFLGTAILVFFGCGSVAVDVLFNAFGGIFQIAMVWGVAVMLAIYVCRHLSCAHFNPAVSIAMAASGRMSKRRLPAYIVAQVAGAFTAAAILYLLISPSLEQFEAINQILRGSAESKRTAMMFGEFYPNPGLGAVVSLKTAFSAEFFGTFILVLFIFSLTEGANLGRPDDGLAPVFIGLTVSGIIIVIAPLTQAGLNPARDFGPRLFSYFTGWGNAAFPDQVGGFFWVYILAPILGGIAAAFVFTKILQPALHNKAKSMGQSISDPGKCC